MAAAVNLYGEDWDEGQDRPGSTWKWTGVGQRLGTELLGAGLYELPPGQRTFPYHWHHGDEELLLVLAGEPTLRTPEGEQRLARGDVAVFRRGPEGAHQLRNDTGSPVRLLLLSTRVRPEVCEYPDSRKVGVYAEDLTLLVRRESGVDYFDGEP